MNQDLGLRVLSSIMNWDDEQARREFAWLRFMARLKYDGYRDFQAGMRFIERLVTWLLQFTDPAERKTAYTFVRETLVYISPSEKQQLVRQFYPRIVQDRIIRMVSTELGIQPYRVLADERAWAAMIQLRRKTLFMGLSDGAHIDTIRHTYSGSLTNEQLVQGTQVDIEKWKDLRDNLREDLKDSTARFRYIYLIDDFAGTGTSFLRFDDAKESWKGKLIRFQESVEMAKGTLGQAELLEDDWELGVHHYMASFAAAAALKNRINRVAACKLKNWVRQIHPTYGMVFPANFPINAGSDSREDFIKLTDLYYDPAIRSKHTDVGGATHMGLGYGRCALPLVLEHNTPNNAVALLWAETPGGDRDGTSYPAMRPLFRRRQRHF